MPPLQHPDRIRQAGCRRAAHLLVPALPDVSRRSGRKSIVCRTRNEAPDRIRDLGALFANEGVWNGVRVISEEWVMRTRQRATTLGGQGYGMLWWKRSYLTNGNNIDTVFASGNGGNYVFIVPSHELVVAFSGSNYNTSRSDTPQQLMPLVLNALR